MAIDFLGADQRRGLGDGAGQGVRRFAEGVQVEAGRVPRRLDLGFPVVARRGGPEGHVPIVGLVFCGEFVDPLGHAAGTDHQDPGGEGVEGAGMAHLDFAESAALADGVTDFVDHIKRGPFEGLVDQQDLTFLEVLPMLEGVHGPTVHVAKVVQRIRMANPRGWGRLSSRAHDPAGPPCLL